VQTGLPQLKDDDDIVPDPTKLLHAGESADYKWVEMDFADIGKVRFEGVADAREIHHD